MWIMHTRTFYVCYSFYHSGVSCKENGVMFLIFNNEGDAERSIVDNAIENVQSSFKGRSNVSLSSHIKSRNIDVLSNIMKFLLPDMIWYSSRSNSC